MGHENQPRERKVSTVHFDDRDIGTANSLSAVMSHLSDIPPHDRKFIESYARAQLFIREGRLHKAGSILSGLQAKTGFEEFREYNGEVLTAIKHLIDGNSRKF